MQYRLPEKGEEWSDVPEKHRYSFFDLVAVEIAQMENDNSAGELFQKDQGRLRDDVVIELRMDEKSEPKTFTMSADYSIDFYAYENA